MAIELKRLIINLKTLDQDIPQPINIGGSNADGRVLRLIFSQQAAAQIADTTIVYLRWKHQQKNISGYVNFEKVNDDATVWDLKWPMSMVNCGEGEVTCCIELVDDISIAPSRTFVVHILQNPTDGSSFTSTDDFDALSQTVTGITGLATKLQKQSDDLDTLETDLEDLKTDLETTMEQAQKMALTITEFVGEDEENGNS